MMWWAIWCAVVVAGAAAAPASDALAPLSSLDLPQIDSLTSDDENLGYSGPAGSRYAPGSPWLYVLADMPRDSQVRRSTGAGERARRGFSVIPAVEVLQRNAYSNYLQHLAHSNRDFLNCIGKRGVARAQQAAHAVAVDRPAHGRAAPEAEPGAGAPRPRRAGRRQQELLERHRQTRGWRGAASGARGRSARCRRCRSTTRWRCCGSGSCWRWLASRCARPASGRPWPTESFSRTSANADSGRTLVQWSTTIRAAGPERFLASRRRTSTIHKLYDKYTTYLLFADRWILVVAFILKFHRIDVAIYYTAANVLGTY